MVTHDRYFLDRITNKIIELNKGRLTTYEANYSKYLSLKASIVEQELSKERNFKRLFGKNMNGLAEGQWLERAKIKKESKNMRI